MDNNNIETGIISLIKKAETELPRDVISALKHTQKIEEGIAKVQIEAILKNIELAKQSGRPMCQDTGVQTFFVNIGFDSPYRYQIKKLIINAVKKATLEIPLRPNTVDPFTGKNKGDNTGEFIPYLTWNFLEGNKIKIIALPKGGGSENMSKLGMLKPGAGIEGIKKFVVDEMLKAGGSPCPPTIVGVGIGGGADLAMKIAKMALLRPLGERHQEKYIADLEEDLLEQINNSGIGPMGLGGKTTVLDVHIEKAHRHPASLPVGLVVQCWAHRKATMVIHANGNWEVE
jgi:fumarate hydratase subunit alpha